MGSVNMEIPYHHGDLKNALITAGIKLLAESGIEGLSLRKLAREVGVSHNAPYMHFADKEAVLAAIAHQGFQILGEGIEEGQHAVAGESLEARLMAAARSYISFALAYPNHLLVMFGKFTTSDYPDLVQTSHLTFHKLVEIMVDGRQSGELCEYEPEQLALLFWMNIHGLSTLFITQKIPDYARQGLTDDGLIQRSVQMICSGILCS